MGQIKDESARSGRVLRKALAKAAPLHIRTVLTDNGKEFAGWLFGQWGRAASGQYEFDQLCAALGIEHRLTRVRRPQTNALFERFNGRMGESCTHRFESRDDLESTLKRCV